MSVSRRMEVFVGGPSRPFELTVRDAVSLSMALDALIAEYQNEVLREGGEPEDPGIIERYRELRARLYVHAGYDPEVAS